MCRREGVKLFLKGVKCSTPKCAFENRSYSPGVHGQRRVKLSDFGLQLREKQKVKRIYNVLEKQFRLYFKKAEKSTGVTGEVLLQLLERRLDNAVFRACFAPSRPKARQMVRHGNILVNGKKVDVPSYTVSVNDVIEVCDKERIKKPVLEEIEDLKDQRGIPEWIGVDEKISKAVILRLPDKKDVGFPIQEALIVELYSK